MATNVFDLYAKLGLDDSEYKRGLDSARSAGSALGSGLATAARIGMQAVTAATTAVVGFGASSVRTGAEFDTSMSQVAATMGTTVDQIQELRDFAQEMGRTTAFSATQSADALNYMALAGYDAETSMSMLPNVLNLAAAGGFELARASDMITDTQTAFGISIERTTQMVDEMAKAASTGNTSVEQLGDAFLTVGGLAQELNGGMVTLDDGTKVAVDGIQELEIALTAMANAGIKGNEAGTHMRNMLLKLSSPTSDGAMALEAMGVAVFDTEGNMRSLADVFGDLSDKLGEMTQEQKIQTISDLFNTRDLASAEALLNAVGEDWDSIGASILDAEGAASAMADTQLDNLAGDITLFKSALEGTKIAISDVLTPALRDFVKFGTDGLSKLTDAFQTGGLDGAMQAFGEILSDGLNMIIEKLPQFIDAGMQLLGALGQGILDNLPVIIDSAIQIIQQLIMGFVEAMPMLVEGALQILLGLANGIAEMLPVLIPTIVDVIITIVETLINNVDLLIDASIALIIGLATGLINALPRLIERIPEIVIKIVSTLIENVPKLNEAAKELIFGLARGLVSFVSKLGEAALDLIVSFCQFITDQRDLIFSSGVELMKSFGESILGFVDTAKTWGHDLINNFIGGIKDKINDVVSTCKDIAGTIADYLGFSEPEKGPLSNFHTYAPDMIDLFTSGIEAGKAQLEDTMNDVLSIPTIDAQPNMSYNSSVDNSNNNVDIASIISEALSNIMVQVRIGDEPFDDMVSTSIQRTAYRSGGRG